jgi:Flp pilus assembly protein TadG
MLVDLVNQVLSVNGLAPQVLAASAQGASKDFSNAKIATGAIVEVGTYGANTTNLQVQIEESSTGTGSWTAIPGMTVSGITAAGHYVVNGQRSHRYVRANAISVQGTTPSVAVSVSVIAEKMYAGSGGGYSRSPST